jgi:hypothetical protein
MNQLSRRNINAYQRSELALMLESMIKAKAKENQIKAGENYGKGMENKQVPQNSAKPIERSKSWIVYYVVDQQSIAVRQYQKDTA